MPIPVPVLIVVSLIISARLRLNAVVFGQPVSIPVIGVIVAALILVLAVAVLLLVRSLVREFRRPRHGWSYS